MTPWGWPDLISKKSCDYRGLGNHCFLLVKQTFRFFDSLGNLFGVPLELPGSFWSPLGVPRTLWKHLFGSPLELTDPALGVTLGIGATEEEPIDLLID